MSLTSSLLLFDILSESSARWWWSYLSPYQQLRDTTHFSAFVLFQEIVRSASITKGGNFSSCLVHFIDLPCHILWYTFCLLSLHDVLIQKVLQRLRAALVHKCAIGTIALQALFHQDGRIPHGFHLIILSYWMFKAHLHLWELEAIISK